MSRDAAAIRSKERHAAPRVLIASGDIPYAATVVKYLEFDGFQAEHCHDSAGVLRQAARKDYDVIVLDLDLADEGGVDLVSYIRRQASRAQLVLVFDTARVDRALEGIRQGAFFYLPKSCQPSDVALVVNKAVRHQRNETTALNHEQNMFEELVGGSPAMKRAVEVIAKVAPTDSTVLLTGESGTGKEVAANLIHRLSPRKDMPFIAVNCAALPEQLLESEMFGHVKGAFTGADADKRGLFEEADGGTIFLDEIGDMSLVTQAKLLRVLQSGEIRRVGASTSGHVNVRVIAATNRDLEQALRERSFREDLYFRLNVIQIRIPPLRERIEALPRLVNHFVKRFNERFGRDVGGFDEAAEALLRNYVYPGNIRELESIIAHAVIMSEGALVRAGDLPEHVRRGASARLALPNPSRQDIPSLRDMEEQLIRAALDRLDGNQTEAAQRLGISRSTLWRKMKEYGISPNG